MKCQKNTKWGKWCQGQIEQYLLICVILRTLRIVWDIWHKSQEMTNHISDHFLNVDLDR
jgi:hypothetical protein